MKKFISIILASALSLTLISGCDNTNKPSSQGNQGSNSDNSGASNVNSNDNSGASDVNSNDNSDASDANSNVSRDKKISVVSTIFPQYDWVKQIAGDKADNFEFTILIDNKIDLHSYQPTVEDIVKVSVCDMFIYVGGESDGWVEDVLDNATNKDMIVINLLDVLGEEVKEEELVEGMQEEEEEGEDTDGDEEEGPELDEHVWLSLRNAEIFCKEIATSLSELDGANADAYSQNLADYIVKLAKLDGDYKSAVDASPVNILLFGDRFPFRYMVDDYGIDYYAAFAGCSAETEASFETIAFLFGKVDELGLKYIMVTESCDGKIADTIIANSTAKNQKVLALNSLQTISVEDTVSGMNYISVMEDNLNVLKEALS